MSRRRHSDEHDDDEIRLEEKTHILLAHTHGQHKFSEKEKMYMAGFQVCIFYLLFFIYIYILIYCFYISFNLFFVNFFVVEFGLFCHGQPGTPRV